MRQNKGNPTQLWLYCILCILLMMPLLSACGNNAADRARASVQEDLTEESILTPVLGGRTLEDGRKVGGSAKGVIGDELTSVFFTFSVNKAELAEAYAEEKAERGFLFLVAEITVTSISEEALPMWADDFILQWGSGENDYAYPYTRFSDAQMEEEFSLELEESVTMDVVYEVPLLSDDTEYNISYLEYYEDEVEGNQFYVLFRL